MKHAEKVTEVMEKTSRVVNRIEYEELTKPEKRIYKQELRRLANAGNLLNVRALFVWSPQPFANQVKDVVKYNIEGDSTSITNCVKWAW